MSLQVVWIDTLLDHEMIDEPAVNMKMCVKPGPYILRFPYPSKNSALVEDQIDPGDDATPESFHDFPVGKPSEFLDLLIQCGSYRGQHPVD